MGIYTHTIADWVLEVHYFFLILDWLAGAGGPLDAWAGCSYACG
jgi:hypothetical protein